MWYRFKQTCENGPDSVRGCWQPRTLGCPFVGDEEGTERYECEKGRDCLTLTTRPASLRNPRETGLVSDPANQDGSRLCVISVMTPLYMAKQVMVRLTQLHPVPTLCTTTTGYEYKTEHSSSDH